MYTFRFDATSEREKRLMWQETPEETIDTSAGSAEICSNAEEVSAAALDCIQAADSSAAVASAITESTNTDTQDIKAAADIVSADTSLAPDASNESVPQELNPDYACKKIGTILFSQYRGARIEHTKDTNSYTISGLPDKLNSIQKFAQARGMRPNITGGKMTVMITHFESGNGYLGPDAKKAEESPEATTRVGMTASDAPPAQKSPSSDNNDNVASSTDRIAMTGSTELPTTTTSEQVTSQNQSEESSTAPSEQKTENNEGKESSAKEDAEKPAETLADRAERIAKETEKALEDLDKKYGKPQEGEQPADKERSTEAGEATATIKEIEKRSETEAQQQKRLYQEVHGNDPDGKNLRTVKEVKDDYDTEEKKLGEQVTTLTQEVATLNEQITTIEELISKNETGGENDKDTLQQQLEQMKTTLAVAEANLQVAQDNQKTRADQIYADKAMLDQMVTATEKLAERSDKRLHAMGMELMSQGEMQFGQGAKDCEVTHNKSLGFDVKVPQLLTAMLIGRLGEQNVQGLESDHPATVLNTLDKALEAVKKQRKRK